MIEKNLKKKLIENLNQLKEVFDESEILNKFMTGDIRDRHFLALKKVLDIEDYDSLSDVRLILLCGIIEFAFPAGDYGFSSGQNLAMNDMLDSIADLKAE